MHLLLPPSETKRSGGGSVFSAEALTHHAALGEARLAVREALEALSSDEEAAAAALKLGAKSRGELAHNLSLGSSGAMPAIERYTGVLYDALDAQSLHAPARAWLDMHASIQSALFGLLGAGDPIPAYRLSAGTRLPWLDTPLKRLWRDAHTEVDWAARGWVLDLRSKDYAELAPLPHGIGDYLHVAQRGPVGRCERSTTSTRRRRVIWCGGLRNPRRRSRIGPDCSTGRRSRVSRCSTARNLGS